MLKKGDRFLHKHWKSSRFTTEEIRRLPAEQTAQEFIITKISLSTCYYRAVYRHSGEIRNLGAAFKHPVDKMGDYVIKILGD